MTTTLILLGLAVVATALFFILRPALPKLLQLRGKRIVTCPETGRKVTVEVDARRAAVGTVRGGDEGLRLRTCSLWPERADCHQKCVGQIESDPEACRFETILNEWYRGQRCALCNKRFESISWHDHKPGLIHDQGRRIHWEEVAPEELVELLPESRPVCWDCQLSEDFRHRFPDLVTDRDWH